MIKSKRMILEGHVVCMGEKWNAYTILVAKPEGKRSLGRPWCGWEDHNNMDHREVGWGYINWIYLAQDKGQWRALVNTVMDLRVP
jgi:hypothetical protein